MDETSILQGATLADTDDLRLVRRLTLQCAPTLKIQTRGGVYPYDVGKELKAPEKFSTSTNSMVAHSVACVAGLMADSKLVGFQLPPDHDGIIDEALLRQARVAVVRIVQQVKSPTDDDSYLSSTAFGVDDPFTIGWLLELLEVAKSWELSCPRQDLDEVIALVVGVAKRRVSTALANPDHPVLDFSQPKAGRAILHPLPLLRIVQIANVLDAGSYEEGLSEAFEWFLTHLHLQLSRRSIQHSGFDIAELVFCLEGMLASSRARVTGSILDSVIAALTDSRQLNSALRATTPFKVTSVGAVHLFTSIEVVSSLLRSAASLSTHDQAAFFLALKPTLQHYLAWLQATMLNGETSFPQSATPFTDPYPPDTPLKFAGWQSEHAHTEDNIIHIWLTSQVLLFLRSYDTLLSADIARQSLAASGLRSEITVRARASSSSADRATQARMDDPLQLSDDSQYRVVSRLEELFVEPHRAGRREDASYSCLLYGPPGTGKTTLAMRVAKELDWDLLTITTSDFIIEGEAQVEARAKAIFETLKLQSETVIFFDEIDRLLLDRDAPEYMRQGDMLQFMTPSMLTKINDLRRAERCIFMIGTNYADRIDSAIKRAGRIDYKFLVLPPDLTRRRQLLLEEVARTRPSSPPLDPAEIEDAAIAGVGRTISELKSAVRDFDRKGGRLAERVEAISPAVSLSTYRRRLPSRNDGSLITEGSNHELLEEAYLVAYLLMESQDGPFPSDHQWLSETWVAARESPIVKDVVVKARLDQIFSQ